MQDRAQSGSMWLVLASCLSIVVLLYLLQVGLQRSAPGEAGSTASRNTRGASSLLQLATTLEFAPEPQRGELASRIPTDVAQIWLISPNEGLTGEEIDNLQRWIVDGGTFVLLTRVDTALSSTQAVFSGGQDASLEEFLAGSHFDQALIRDADFEQLTPLAEWAEVPWELPAQVDDVPRGLPVAPLVPGHPLLDGLPPLLAVPYFQGNAWRLPVLAIPAQTGSLDTLRPLIGNAEHVVLAERRLGNGRVIVSTQPEWATNALLPSPACATLMSRLLGYRQRPGRTWFLENPHGFNGQLRGFDDLLAASWGRALVWIGVVLVLGILSFGTRFIAPLPAPAAPRPEPGEYVEALGRLYARAGSWSTVTYNLHSYFQYVARSTQTSAAPHLALSRRRRGQRIVAALEATDQHHDSPEQLRALLRTPEMDQSA